MGMSLRIERNNTSTAVLIIAAAILGWLAWESHQKNEQLWIQIFGAATATLMLILLAFAKTVEKNISKKELIDSYTKHLEKEYRTTIMPNFNVFWDEPIGNIYSFVLQDQDSDGINRYFPCEMDRKTGDFLRGSGRIIDDYNEVQIWINERRKVPLSSELLKRISAEMDSKLLKALNSSPDKVKEAQQAAQKERES